MSDDQSRAKHAAEMRAWRERQRGLDDAAIADRAANGDGPVVAATKAQLAGLSAAEEQPGIVAGCLVLAADLDNPKLATSHASLYKQLALALGKLKQASHSTRGRLASVAAMSDAKKRAPR